MCIFPTRVEIIINYSMQMCHFQIELERDMFKIQATNQDSSETSFKNTKLTHSHTFLFLASFF